MLLSLFLGRYLLVTQLYSPQGRKMAISIIDHLSKTLKARDENFIWKMNWLTCATIWLNNIHFDRLAICPLQPLKFS